MAGIQIVDLCGDSSDDEQEDKVVLLENIVVVSSDDEQMIHSDVGYSGEDSTEESDFAVNNDDSSSNSEEDFSTNSGITSATHECLRHGYKRRHSQQKRSKTSKRLKSDVSLPAMWEKAGMLLHNRMVSNVPGYTDGRMVGSITHPEKPHLVSIFKSGKASCDCLNYKSKSLCAHTIVTAESMGKLVKLIDWFKCTNQEPNMWKLARSGSGIPKHLGHKPGQSHRNRKSITALPTEHISRIPFSLPSLPTALSGSSSDVVESDNIGTKAHGNVPPPVISITSPVIGPSVTTSCAIAPSISIVSPITAPRVIVSQPSCSNAATTSGQTPLSIYPFSLKFITNRIIKCQGCRKNFRPNTEYVLHPPSDLIISRLENRPFICPDGTTHTPGTPSTYHYHLQLSCLRAAAPADTGPLKIMIPDDVKARLLPCHKLSLYSEIGLCVS